MTQRDESNSPYPDSLFRELNELSCCCLGCKAVVRNDTAGRAAHLDDCPAWEAHCNGETVEGWDA